MGLRRYGVYGFDVDDICKVLGKVSRWPHDGMRSEIRRLVGMVERRNSGADLLCDTTGCSGLICFQKCNMRYLRCGLVFLRKTAPFLGRDDVGGLCAINCINQFASVISNILRRTANTIWHFPPTFQDKSNFTNSATIDISDNARTPFISITRVINHTDLHLGLSSSEYLGKVSIGVPSISDGVLLCSSFIFSDIR